MSQLCALFARQAEPKCVERFLDEPCDVPEDAEKSVGGAAFDGDDGLEGMVLRGRGRRRAVKLDVSACGESAPAVERHDHRRIDAQKLACGGKGDQIGFGTVAVPGADEGAAVSGKGCLRSVRKKEYLSAFGVEEVFCGGEGGGEGRGQQHVVLEDEGGGDALIDHPAVDGLVGERAADLSRRVETSACQHCMEAGDGGASGGRRERGTVHGGQAHRLHACL